MRRAIPVLILTALLSSSGWAQEKKDEPKPEQTSKVFEVKPGNVDHISAVLRQLLGSGSVTADSSAGLLVVRTSPTMLPAIEEAVKRLDAAAVAPNVEMTFYILQASQEPAASAAIPPELQSAVAQLKSAFGYQGFQLLDTAVIHSRVGDWAGIGGVLSFSQEESVPYNVRFRAGVQGNEQARTIRIERLNFEARVPVKNQGLSSVGIQANFDVKEGQKVVVGKTGIEGNRRALILVVTGKIVD
jgi:hypothetical protein